LLALQCSNALKSLSTPLF